MAVDAATLEKETLQWQLTRPHRKKKRCNGRGRGDIGKRNLTMAVGADTWTKEISQWQRFVLPWELYGSPWLWKSRNGCGNAYAAVGNSTTAISHSNFAPDAGDSSSSSLMWQPQPQSRWRHRLRRARPESA